MLLTFRNGRTGDITSFILGSSGLGVRSISHAFALFSFLLEVRAFVRIDVPETPRDEADTAVLVVVAVPAVVTLVLPEESVRVVATLTGREEGMRPKPTPSARMAALLSCFFSRTGPLRLSTVEDAFSFSASISLAEARDFSAALLVVPALVPDAEMEEELGDCDADARTEEAVAGANFKVPLAVPAPVERPLTAPADSGLLLAVAVSALTRVALAPAGLATALETTALIESIALGRVVANLLLPTTAVLVRGLGGDGEEMPVT